MDEIIKITKWLEHWDVLIDVVSKTMKNEIKKREGGFLNMLLGSLGGSMLGNIVTGKGFMRKWRAGRTYNNMDQMDKLFKFRSIF